MLQLVCCKSTTGGCKKESEEHKDVRKVVWANFCTKHQQTAVHIERGNEEGKEEYFHQQIGRNFHSFVRCWNWNTGE